MTGRARYIPDREELRAEREKRNREREERRAQQRALFVKLRLQYRHTLQSTDPATDRVLVYGLKTLIGDEGMGMVLPGDELEQRVLRKIFHHG